MREPFSIGGREISPGHRLTIGLPIGSFSNHMPSTLPVRVIHGRRPGPIMFVSAAIHGDEVIGVEIIRRLLASSALKSIKGTLLCVPVVNTYGFVSRSRYLPDRRDLNRCFPGAQNGSLAGQLAYIFMEEIVKKCQFGIDLHSAAEHRANLPQIRYDSENPETVEAAKAFGAPLILHAPLRDGSLRMAARDLNIEMLLFEAGEALRFDEFSVRVGVKGILNVMRHIGMLSGTKLTIPKVAPVVSSGSKWVRAPVGGLFRAIKPNGDSVAAGDTLGYISDPFGGDENLVEASISGVIIGKSNLPIVNPGDAVFHIAHVRGPQSAEARISSVGKEIDNDPLFDEDEII